MAIAAEELSPAVGEAYNRIVAAGGKAGKESLRAARQAVAAAAAPKARNSSAEPSPAPSRPSHRVTGRGLAFGNPLGRAPGGGARAGGRLVGSVAPGGGVARVLFALAAFVLALELGSMLTGTYFTWDLRAPWNRVKRAGTYIGLYPGQLDKLTSPPAGPTTSPTTAASAFPYGFADRPDRTAPPSAPPPAPASSPPAPAQPGQLRPY